MEKDGRIQYLANLFVSATLTGGLTAAHEAALEDIRKSLKCTKADVTRAQQLSLDGKIGFAGIPRVSQRIQNLEDTVFLILMGSDSDPFRHACVAEAANQLNLDASLRAALTDEASRRLSLLRPVCPKCGTVNQSGAGFCTKCGANIGGRKTLAEVGVALELAPVMQGITVAFAESTAAGFTDAVRFAEGLSSFQRYKKGTKSWFAASFKSDERGALLSLVKDLKGMRNREAYLDGKKVAWDAVFEFTYCAVRRESAFRPTEFCFGEAEHNQNCWGCGQLGLPWAEWSDWFSWGRFVNETTFEFDVARIEHELRAKMGSVRLCPYFNETFVESAIASFPKSVTVTSDGDWQYEEHYGSGGGGIDVKTLVDYGDGEMYAESIHATGVKPKGRKALLRLIHATASQVGVPLDDVPSR